MTIHTLEKEKHNDFLNQERVDPITGDLLEANDRIVICASCKSAFLVDSWEYMDGKHCNQSLSLREIPKSEIVKIEKNLLAYAVEIPTFSNSTAACVRAVIPSLLSTLPFMLYFSFSLPLLNVLGIIPGIFPIGFFIISLYYTLYSPYDDNLKVGKYAITLKKNGGKNTTILYEDIISIELQKQKRFGFLNKFRNLFSSKNDIYTLKITDKNQSIREVLIEGNALKYLKTETTLLELLNKTSLISSINLENEQLIEQLLAQ